MAFPAFAQPSPLSLRHPNLVSATCARKLPKRLSRRASTVKNSLQNETPSNPLCKFQVNFTWLENNSFILEFGQSRLLIDPWLTDDLVFLTPKFYKQRKAVTQTATWDDFHISTIDAIVLTQGLADHAHPPTLAKLPKTLPVVAPKSAVPLLRSLGYSNIIQTTYGQTVQPLSSVPAIQLTACRGSIVGPPWSDAQLGYMFSFRDELSNDPDDMLRIYHEPHGNHDFEFLQQYAGKIDTVIAPIIATKIPALGDYALVNGIPEAMALCTATIPSACMPFDNSAGEQSGFLTNYLQTSGGRAAFAEAVAREPRLKDMTIIDAPRTLESVAIASKRAQVENVQL